MLKAPFLAMKSSLYDVIIDLRPEASYKEDHIPGAINVSATGDGTEEISLQAMRSFVAEATKDLEVGSSVLLYTDCGTERAQQLADGLADRRIKAQVLEGGYIAYRAWVERKLKCLASKMQFHVITGSVGCGKTDLLRAIADEGAQTIDLQQLMTDHGGTAGSGSKAFFLSSLCAELCKMDGDEPVWVEYCMDSNVTAWLTEDLKKALVRPEQVYLLSAPMEERIKAFGGTHAEYMDKPAELVRMLKSRSTTMSPDTAIDLESKAAANQWESVVSGIIGGHYDQRHKRSLERMGSLGNVVKMALAKLDKSELKRVARALVQG